MALATLLAALAGGDGQHSWRLAVAAVAGESSVEVQHGRQAAWQASWAAHSELHLMPAVKSPQSPLP